MRRSARIYSAVPLDTALPRSAFISDRDFARSDFYDEFVRPMGGFHSVGTVRFHLKNAYQKTGTRSQAALVAPARGFARPDRS